MALKRDILLLNISFNLWLIVLEESDMVEEAKGLDFVKILLEICCSIILKQPYRQ